MTSEQDGWTGGHVIVADLGYGDAGKGTVTDWLCSPASGPAGRRPRTVVRFNGGAQAAHNVITPDGRHHTFAQFGSGTFTPGVRTHLSRYVLVDPLALAAEAGHLEQLGVTDALDRLTVARDALLATPYHRAANRARERSRPPGQRHGSCGMGIGETARYALEFPADALRAGDCAAPGTLDRKLRLLRDWLAAQQGQDDLPDLAGLAAAYRAFADRVTLTGQGYLSRLLREGPAVFEGAQGVLLDEWHGFHPFTTWSTTTFSNARQLLAEAGQAAVRLGVVRCYLTRHGPGPLVTQDPTLELPELHNMHNEWQGAFRLAHFDAVAHRYAIEVSGGVDAIALTHLDAADRAPLHACDSYLIDGQLTARLPAGQPGDLDRQAVLTGRLLKATPRYLPGAPVRAADWPDLASQLLGAPVTLLSRGPTALDKEVRQLASRPGAA